MAEISLIVKKTAFLSVLALLLFGCTKERFEVVGDGPLDLMVSTRSIIGTTQDDITIRKVRIIICDRKKGIAVLNQTDNTIEQDADNNFVLRLNAGEYIAFVVVNETETMTGELVNVYNINQLRAVKHINPHLITLTDNVLSAQEEFNLRASEDDPTKGEVQTTEDGEWSNLLTVKTVRAFNRFSLYLRKSSETPIIAIDNSATKGVLLKNVPTWNYLMSG